MIKFNITLFREAIRKRRIELGLTQKQLAEKTGLTASTISKIEHGKIEPPYKKIDLFAKALQTEPQNLISDIEKSGRLLECLSIESNK